MRTRVLLNRCHRPPQLKWRPLFAFLQQPKWASSCIFFDCTSEVWARLSSLASFISFQSRASFRFMLPSFCQFQLIIQRIKNHENIFPLSDFLSLSLKDSSLLPLYFSMSFMSYYVPIRFSLNLLRFLAVFLFLSLPYALFSLISFLVLLFFYIIMYCCNVFLISFISLSFQLLFLVVPTFLFLILKLLFHSSHFFYFFDFRFDQNKKRWAAFYIF